MLGDANPPATARMLVARGEDARATWRIGKGGWGQDQGRIGGGRAPSVPGGGKAWLPLGHFCPLQAITGCSIPSPTEG